MHCHRCRSTMVQTSIQAHHSSIQQWFSCPLCTQQAVRTTYQASSVTKVEASFAGDSNALIGLELTRPS